MQLNHLNLCVTDLTEATTFFQKHFYFQLLEEKGKLLTVMTDGHGFTLVLMNPQALKNEMSGYPAGFHLGFIVESYEQVDRIYDRLLTAEIQLTQQPRKVHGSYGFYFTALNDILFEISCPN